MDTLAVQGRSCPRQMGLDGVGGCVPQSRQVLSFCTLPCAQVVIG